VYAQLVIMDKKLFDTDDNKFEVEKHLQARGLPIYVFEQTDEE